MQKKLLSTAVIAIFTAALFLNISFNESGLSIGQNVNARNVSEWCHGAELAIKIVEWSFPGGVTFGDCCVNRDQVASACDQTKDDSRCDEIICKPLPE